MSGVKNKIMSLFKKNIINNYSKSTRFKNLYDRGKKNRQLTIQKQSGDNLFKNIKILFKLFQETEAIKDRIIRDSKILLNKQMIITI